MTDHVTRLREQLRIVFEADETPTTQYDVEEYQHNADIAALLDAQERLIGLLRKRGHYGDCDLELGHSPDCRVLLSKGERMTETTARERLVALRQKADV